MPVEKDTTQGSSNSPVGVEDTTYVVREESSMRIYIAGPYTKGDVAINVNKAIKAADKLIAKGHLPYVPHLTHFWHLMSPKPYEFWIFLDASVLRHWAEAILRIEGVSLGADNEVEIAKSLHLTVYYDIDDIPEE